tara:strand:+ start:135 stop:833 length:699 start_codon:yes stop_codon:yes gene_type:complete
MFILLLLINTSSAQVLPVIQQDTCAMAAQSIHTFTAGLLVRHQYPIIGKEAKKAKTEVSTKKMAAAVHDYKFWKMKEGVNKQTESQFLHTEPALMSAYRIRESFNPCDQLDNKIKSSIEENQNYVKRSCLGNSNPYAIIKYPHHAWSSEGALQEGLVSMFAECSPNKNSRALFLKHQVANAYDVSADRLCRAAWSGLKEAWSEYKYCQVRALGWVELNAWSNGEIKRVPAQE